MSYTCDRCQRELFSPESWNTHLNPEQHIDAQRREDEGLDLIDPGYGYGFDATLRDLQASRDHGCSFCDLLIARINQLAKEWQATDLLHILVAPRLPRRVSPPRIEAIDISITRKEHTEGYVWFATGISAHSGIGESFFVHGPDETEPNFAAPIARSWLQECLSNHQLCQVTKSRTLPSRALYISSCNGSVHTKLEMHPPDDIQYVFLSYRWGGDQKLKLTQESSDKLTQGIPLSSLPGTLKDAVKVTLDLGIPYIWIDALCIFQDSTEDLAKEIVNMESYIQQAVLFGEQIGTQRGASYSAVLDPNAPFYQPDKEPVNSRAWIMQERLLCPRVLILPSVGGMLWQCDTHERIYGQIHYAYYVESDRSRIAATWRQWDLSPQVPLSAKEVHNAWITQVDDYNKRDLTNPRDKLLAISGLAKRFQHNYGNVLGAYCAGSWYNFLNLSLHWHTGLEGRSAPAIRPTTKSIPSWSWANVHNSMYLSKGQPIMHPHLRIAVISCEVNLVTPGFAFGDVAGGRLELQGVLVEVYWDHEESVFENLEGSSSALGDPKEEHLGFVEFDFEQDEVRGNANVGLLLPVTESGAVLLRETDAPGTYMRIGYGILSDYSRLYNAWQSRWPRTSIVIQ
ncbi:hypothetical protein NPX13_g4083 [Xylaria arbuscula]|uniref:C2H2-type domain-containing protein n=1 Tax=Xylaria arbuscula TaxID=114810 RepID=A0A9W8NH23_9PEZI|nr:hypothetical protein NPX13_g4083 [Xylaria arbuscula]